MTIVVETAARLHFGVLDLRESRGRWFGGLGAAAPGPALVVEAADAAAPLAVSGEDATRAEAFARRFLDAMGLPVRGRLHVAAALPAHAGLGSGTQLALAVGRALAELHGVTLDVPSIARATRRGRRSAVGTWTFAGGGLVVEGGRRLDSEQCGPLLSRLPLPSSWRCVLAVPAGDAGISGPVEAAAFEDLPLPAVREAEHVAHLVLMTLLPAVAEGDLPAFGAALSEIQQITGNWFAPIQGGTFAPGASSLLVRRMETCGAVGVGQSSWGPAVYGIVDGDAAARLVTDEVRPLVGLGAVYQGPFRNHGAMVTRARGD